nr:IS3 family transposase [Glaciihabitans tibetensis]
MVCALIAAGTSTVAACALAGYPRGSFYRDRAGPAIPVTDPIPQRLRPQPAMLDQTERDRVLALISDSKYAGLSLSQIFFRAWDDGHWVASKSTWYRIARAARLELRKHRKRASKNPRKIPELIASAPTQVWSWDITKLKGPRYGQWFHWYVIIDIFSRKIVGWRLDEYEDGTFAQQMITAAVASNGAEPRFFHSDNGAAMISKPVALLLERLGITRSFSRPKVSNDNPFSEALFRTGKYVPQFPEVFDNITHAREWAGWFVHEYNMNHRHSGIGYHTPNDVHEGLTLEIDTARTRTLNLAYAIHPERFTTPPTPPRVPTHSAINDPRGKTTPTPTLTLSHTG